MTTAENARLADQADRAAQDVKGAEDVKGVGDTEGPDGAGVAEGAEGAEGAGKAAAGPAGAADPAGDGQAAAPRRRAGWLRAARPRGWRHAAVAAAVAVLLLASGGLLYATQALKDPAASGNSALTDTATTDQVIGDVSSALSQIFAYTPDDTASTEKAARSVLAGSAATQYQALFAQIKQNVAAQQLTLTTRVVRAGVVSLDAHRATLLVFLDQTAQRAGAAATTAAAQLSVTAEPKNGHWRITVLKAR